MVNTKLYVLCALGGFAVYFLFMGIMYASLRKPVGTAYYQGGPFSSRKEQVQGISSAIMSLALLVLYYYFRKTQPEQMNEQVKTTMYIFVFAVGLISSRSIFPLLMTFILPAGIYEQAIITTRGMVRYKSITSYDIYDTGKKRDADVLYLRLNQSTSQLTGSKMLVIDRDDKTKVQKIMKQRMASIDKQY